MSQPRIFLDEDSSAHRLVAALRAAGIEVLSALELGRLRIPDDEQLEFAIAQRCILITANKAHLAALHASLANAGKEHWGIFIRSSQEESPERLAAAVITVLGLRPAESFQNALLYV